MDTNIRICGQAGQGIQSMGDMLCRALAALGLHVFSSQNYMSRIRGGVNSFDIRISDHELFAPRDKAELIVALNEEAYLKHRKEMNWDGVILYNTAEHGNYIAIDFSAEAKNAGGAPVMGNTVAAGAVLGLLGYGPDALCNLMDDEFHKKGENVVEQNKICARHGAEHIAGHEGLVRAPKSVEASPFVYSGSQSVGQSAAVAGVRFVSSYPMTPGTGVLTYLAGAADKYGLVVEQAEDEIAAVNMICGATFAGAPAMTTTSGGGFSLMVEGLSLAGILELPIVILLSQRPGPATGMPTKTAQGDLDCAVFSGHGEFPRIVLTPGSVAQAFDITRRAFEMAHKFQTPAIIMIDQFLADAQQNMPELPAAIDPIDRCIVENPGQDYVRFAVTDSGISPRAVPGGDAFVVCTSDEHSEDGHISEDYTVRTAMHDKRLRKNTAILAEFIAPEVYPEPDEHVLLCWGSTYGPCREAVDRMRKNKRPVCMVHLPQVWPLDEQKLSALLHGRRVTAVEGNATAMLARLLKRQGILDEYDTLLRYDGLPFTADTIIRGIAK